VEPNRIGKTVLVIDEAQDMGKDDFALVSALMKANEEMRVIAVGDDDQNIYEFRGSDSQYMYRLSQVPGGKLVEMTDNYRSTRHIVDAANAFVRGISHRIKSMPIVSMSKDDGMVRITQHLSSYMYEPIADDVARHGKGTTCVLTQTNEEAVIMLALLCKRGIKGKLIQSMDGFRFLNLAETKYFLKLINAGLTRLKSP
jgi:ATP-dependent DNA helicase RecQ